MARAVKVKLGALADNDEENDDDDDEDESDMVPSACASGGIADECAPAESSARAVFPRDPPSSECSNCVRVDGTAPPLPLAVATWSAAVPVTAVVAAAATTPVPTPVAAPTAASPAFSPDPFELCNGAATLACCGATAAGAASRDAEGTAFFPPPR